jgi:hypothetical protein
VVILEKEKEVLGILVVLQAPVFPGQQLERGERRNRYDPDDETVADGVNSPLATRAAFRALKRSQLSSAMAKSTSCVARRASRPKTWVINMSRAVAPTRR